MGRHERMSLAILIVIALMPLSETHQAPQKKPGDELVPEDPSNAYPPEDASAPAEQTHCFNSCSAHGDCVPVNGKWECHCDNGYTGDDCGSLLVPLVKRCPKDCNMHGSCVSNNDQYVCHCDKGWSGVDCSQRLLSQVTDTHEGTRTTYEELNIDPNIERIDTHLPNGVDTSNTLVGSGNPVLPVQETPMRPDSHEHDEQDTQKATPDTPTSTSTPTPTFTPTPTWNLDERTSTQPRVLIVNGTSIVTPTPTPTTVGLHPPADCTPAEQEVFELCVGSTMDGETSCDPERCEFVSSCDCIYPNGNEVCGPAGTGVCLPRGQEIQQLCVVRYSAVKWRTFGLRRGAVHISDLGGCPFELGGVSYPLQLMESTELPSAAAFTSSIVSLTVATILALYARI